MNPWKTIIAICWVLLLLLLFGMSWHLFRPLIERQQSLRARQEELRRDIQKSAEDLRMLRLKQEKLQTDPAFIERIAREELGYAKPGETVFKFVDDDRSYRSNAH